MGRIHLVSVVGMILIAPIFAFGQSSQLTSQRPKSIEVTTRTMAKQPRGKPYVIDLTQKGKTYTVAADVANRVRIRTSEGEMTMTDFMSKMGATSGRFSPRSKFLIGTATDLRAMNFGIPPSRTFPTATAKNFKCGPILPVCECSGIADCIELSFACEVILCGPSETPGKTICLCTKLPLPRFPG